ncbi:MAG: BofC C-terminal domain-containing protein [Lachnospirales bacterium]
MKKLFLYASIVTLTALSFLGTYIIAYNKYTTNTDNIEMLSIDDNLSTNISKNPVVDTTTDTAETNAQENKSLKKEISTPEQELQSEHFGLSDTAKFVFRKKYKNGEIDEEIVEIPEYFVGRDYEYIQTAFSTFTITDFTKDKVVFEKDILTESYYLIGEKDGYVQVFFIDVDESVTLKERVNTPIETLSEKDQAMLKKGIRFETEAEVNRAIENYES